MLVCLFNQKINRLFYFITAFGTRHIKFTEDTAIMGCTHIEVL